jgi:hypothetical protein
MTRGQIYEFFSRFDGPEGCSTRSICLLTAIRLNVKDAHGSFSWECPGDRSKTLSRQILTHMGVLGQDQKRFLALIDLYEGRCECESLSSILEEEDGVRDFADEFLAMKGNGSSAYSPK